MIRPRSEMRPKGPIEIDLQGPSGNVFYLIGLAQQLSKKVFDNRHPDMDDEQEISEVMIGLGSKDFECHDTMAKWISDKMMETDYENAVTIFEKYFGDYVILYR
jgi:hypothetical protein